MGEEAIAASITGPGIDGGSVDVSGGTLPPLVPRPTFFINSEYLKPVWFPGPPPRKMRHGVIYPNGWSPQDVFITTHCEGAD